MLFCFVLLLTIKETSQAVKKLNSRMFGKTKRIVFFGESVTTMRIFYSTNTSTVVWPSGASTSTSFPTTGRFVIGGPAGDSGLTGRKIIVDTYGGYASHGGGAFSGKDPTKVDRSAAYAARYLAKNVVASGVAPRCEIQIAYAIGVAKPVSVLVNTSGTGKVEDEKIAAALCELVDLRPAAIINRFGLRRPIYSGLAAYGHMGREDLNAPWEQTDVAAALAAKLN